LHFPGTGDTLTIKAGKTGSFGSPFGTGGFSVKIGGLITMALPMDRAAALELLKTHTHTQSLIHHAISVEAAMRHFAEFYGENVEYWGMVGLLHDLDYEEHPEEHCQYTPGYLREAGFDEDFIRAVLSHGYGLCTDVKPEKQMEKVIYTVDELTGFITAVALMRPSKSLLDLEVKSVKKKFKDKAFAAKVNRDLIRGGAEMMGMELDQVMEHCILALRTINAELGFQPLAE
jgi:putative nucleotidyltransferase with HDIG domain